MPPSKFKVLQIEFANSLPENKSRKQKPKKRTSTHSALQLQQEDTIWKSCPHSFMISAASSMTVIMTAIPYAVKMYARVHS